MITPKFQASDERIRTGTGLNSKNISFGSSLSIAPIGFYRLAPYRVDEY